MRRGEHRVGIANRTHANRVVRRLAVVGVLAALVFGVASGVVLAQPASAAQVVNGCTIVPSPTATNRTNCPNKNLSGANLAGLDLSYANFSGSNLKGADLSNSNLRQANLSFSNLKGAHLGGANLSGANVRGANLQAFFAATVMPNGSINSAGATIAVSPATATVPNGLTQAFAATATYSDGTNVLLAKNVTWSSSNNQVATVASTGLAKGVVPNASYDLANFPKTATIKAAAGGASGTAGLTVGPPNLTAVAVTPASPAIVVGNTQQLSATGTYSDASTAPLAGVAWSSGTPSIAAIDNAGLATGVAAGPTTITASSGPLSGTATLAVVDALTITTASPLPVGVQGSPYSQTLAAVGGVGPYTWSKESGAVPPGLTLNQNGTITGTPTAAGTLNLVVKADDAGPPAQSNTKALQIEVKPPLGITTNSLASGVVGSSYSQTLAADGGITPYSWSVTQGSLPNGLILNPATGEMSGTPATAGTFAFSVQATDAQSPPHSTAKALSIDVANALVPAFGAESDAVAGQAFTTTPLSVSGGTPPYTWSVTEGTLPAGLNLNTATGEISGTPMAPGTSAFTVQAVDSGSLIPQKATRAVTINVLAPLSITTTSLQDGLAATSYSQSLAATGGGGPPYSWSLTQGSLPTGLSLNGVTGEISGTPTTPGTSSFTVRLDKIGSPAPPVTKALSIRIVPAPLVLGSFFAPNAVNGSPYSATPTVSGGTTPFSWSISQGSLPAGLTLNSATGEISGTPNSATSSSFTIQVSDSAGQSATKALSVTVLNPVTITPPSLPQAHLGAGYDAELTATGGTPGQIIGNPYDWSVSAGALPTGLTLNATTGHITGIPSVGGTFTFTVRATDFGGLGGTQSATRELSITAFGISTSSLPGATQGVGYQAQLSASGGTPPYAFTRDGFSLPPGLILSETGAISGTPTTAGRYDITFRVCDRAPCPIVLGDVETLRASRVLTIVVAPGTGPGSLSITTTSLPNAFQNVPYSAFLVATGGTGPYTWSISSGQLPPGVVLDASTGEIHGTPTGDPAKYGFFARVTDSSSPPQTVIRDGLQIEVLDAGCAQVICV